MARKKANAEPKAKKRFFKKKEEVVKTEVVDLDKKLAETVEVSGSGIQAYMREKIKNATRG